MSIVFKQPLAVTPSPAKGEALSGFILRTSAQNGYANPAKLFSYADMTDNEARSVRPPLEKLAPLYGKTENELISAGLDHINDATPARHLPVMGQCIPFMFTRSKNAGLCLQCVQEHGFISAFHELKYALACPQHHCKTILACPSCHSPLNWQRRNLTTCSCGADLSVLLPQKVENATILILLGILHAKLMREPLQHDEMKASGFPIDAIEQLSIQTLLSMIYRFGLFNQKQQLIENEIEADWLALKTTAEVLSDWPNKFHDYLETVHAPTANLKVSGLRGQFNSFYESFFKNIEQDQELQFMRDAFVKFGQERWRQAGIHSKLLSEQTSANPLSYGLGMQAFSEKIGVRPATAKKLIARGLVQVTMSELNQTRKLIELSPQQQFAFAAGKNLSIKKAAEILDLPVAILRVYRARGYYQARYLAIPIELFHERDVESLHQDLMHGCEPCKVFISDRHITMAQVMRMKTNADVKATFIADVKNRRITPLGTVSNKPSGLVFDLYTTKKHLTDIKQRLCGGVSFETAKEILQVDQKTLLSLVKNDVLQYQYQYSDLTLSVVEQSVVDFDAEYVTCAQIAQIKSLSIKAVIELCHDLKIKLIQVSQTDMFKPTIIWIEKTQLPLLGIVDAADVIYSKAA